MACVRDTSTTRPSIPGTESSGTGLFDSFLAENLYNIMTSPLVSPFLPASSLRSSGSQPIEDREDFSDAPTTSTALMLPNVFFDGSEEPVQDRKKSPIAKSYASSHSSPTSTSFMQPGLYSNGPKEPVQDRKISLDAVSSTVSQSPPTSIDVVSSQSPPSSTAFMLPKPHSNGSEKPFEDRRTSIDEVSPADSYSSPSSTAFMLPKPHSNGSEKSFEDRRPFVDVVTPVSFHSPTPIAIMPPRSYPQESEEPVEDRRISTIDTVSTAHSLSPSTGLLRASMHHNGPGLVQYREIPRDAVPPGFSHSQSSSNGYIHTPLLHSKGLELVPNRNILVDSTSPARPCSPSTTITYRNTPIPHFSRQEPIQDRLVTIDAMPSSTASASPLGGSALQPLSNKTVGVDTFQALMASISAPSMDMDMLCSSCRTPVPAIAKCVDCDALFCASCVIAHDLAFNTAAHKIVTFPSAYLSQYQIAISDHDSNEQMDECKEHPLPIRVQCHTCNKLFCAECPLEVHMKHDIRIIENRIIQAWHINKELRNKIRKIITEVERAMKMVKDESIRNDQSRRDTISLVLGELKRYRQDINNQEVEVIQRIDETSQNKDRQLKSQLDNLQSMLMQLYHTEELLKSSSRHSNEMELCTLNERAKMKMREVLVLIPEIITSEGVLTFTVQNGERAIDTLSNIGEFSIGRPQTMRPIVGARHPSPGYPRQENPRQGNPRQGNPRQGNPRQGNPRQGNPRQGNPRQGNSRQGHPRQWNARNGFSRPGNGGSVISRNVVSRPLIKKEKFEFAFNRAIHGTGPVVVKYSMPPESSFVFGKAGGDEGLLCRPWGVCCDHNGNIIVADRSNNRIQVFDSEGRFKFAFGKFGSEKGEFNKPAGLRVNHEGNIVVCDKDNHRVQMFTPNGTFLRSFGRFGDKTGEFNYPWDLACNKIGHIVVSDTRNHRIQLFSSFGLFLGKFGYEESANNMMKQFECPRGVTFLPDGQIAVTEFNNHRLVIIDSNLEEAKFYGKQGSDTDDFFRPQGIICDDEGNIVVSDSKNHRIKVIFNDGRVSMIGTKGSNLGQVDVPSGICLSPDGRIIVVDFGNSRIQVF